MTDGQLREMCLNVEFKSCPCEGKKSTHSWYPNNNPSCIDTISDGIGSEEKRECFIASLCKHKFPDITVPECPDPNKCKIPMFNGGEFAPDVCEEWECVNDVMKQSQQYVIANRKVSKQEL